VQLTCTNQFRTATFDIANITYFFTKQATLMSTVLSHPLQLVFPGDTLAREYYRGSITVLLTSYFTGLESSV